MTTPLPSGDAPLRDALRRAWADGHLRAALAVGGLLRVLPLLFWPDKPCVRDECNYLDMANALLDGRGIIGTMGWLWAPGYPAVVAAHKGLLGVAEATHWTQLGVALLSLILLYALAEPEVGRRPARAAVWLLALSPTHIFFVGTFWSETLYTGLLLGLALAVRAARSGGLARGLVVGLILGISVLFRGVATYLLPLALLGILGGRWRAREAWAGAAAALLAAVLTVAPYSAYATHKFGGLVISDRTLGQMMWQGNNRFPPMSFDYGNGTMTDAAFDAVAATGRRHCKPSGNPVRNDSCEMKYGLAWIRDNPLEFIARMPLRVSQMLTPHSFLTRHLRWGRWIGFPQPAREALIVLVPAFSFATLLGGTLGLCARARGWIAAFLAGVVLYHVAAVAATCGLSRYRVPLEALWMVYAGAFWADPRGALATLTADRARGAVAVVLTVVTAVLMLRFLPVAWPGWGRW